MEKSTASFPSMANKAFLAAGGHGDTTRRNDASRSQQESLREDDGQ